MPIDSLSDPHQGSNGTLFDPSGASGGFGGPKLPIELVDWSDIRFDSYYIEHADHKYERNFVISHQEKKLSWSFVSFC